MGTLTIEDGPDSTYATASIDGTTLTVIPTQTAGTTSLTLKEANGNQTARINITVTGTSIDASEKDVTVYVGGDSKNVNITGTEMRSIKYRDTSRWSTCSSRIKWKHINNSTKSRRTNKCNNKRVKRK